jgi:hypothetical protein
VGNELQSAPTEFYLKTVAQAADILGISRQEMDRRTKAGHPRRVLCTVGPRGKLIDMRSLIGPEAQIWRESLLAELSERDRAAAREVPPENQLSLLPQTALDKKIAEATLELTKSESDFALRWLRIVEPCANHTWKALGYSSQDKYLEIIAKREGISRRTIQRKVSAFKKSGDVRDLVNERRGPERGAHTILDADMQAHLTDCYAAKKLTIIQCFESLTRYLSTKQNSPGCRVAHFYRLPSYSTVRLYLRSLDAVHQAERQGPEAMKAVAGYIGRHYLDLKAGDAWCIDEWQCDGLFYLEEKRTVVERPYIITVLDQRSRRVMNWTLTLSLNSGVVLDLLEETIRRYWKPLRLISDKGGHFRVMLRGHWKKAGIGSHEELMKPARGALELLGVEFVTSRKEKNPRANRIERLHGIYAQLARRDFGLSWCGANIQERKQTGIDDCVSRHKDLYCTGKALAPGGRFSELFSLSELAGIIEKWPMEINCKPSDANSLDGLAPEACWNENIPPATEIEGRRPDEQILSLAFAETFPESVIYDGGLIKIGAAFAKDRYRSTELILRKGERCEVRRLRHDHSFVYAILQDGKQVRVPRLVPIGVNDPEGLREASESYYSRRKNLQAMFHSAPAPLPLKPSLPVTSEDIARSAFELECSAERPTLSFASDSAARILEAMESEERLTTSEDVASRALEVELEGPSRAGESETEVLPPREISSSEYLSNPGKFHINRKKKLPPGGTAWWLKGK